MICEFTKNSYKKTVYEISLFRHSTFRFLLYIAFFIDKDYDFIKGVRAMSSNNKPNKMSPSLRKITWLIVLIVLPIIIFGSSFTVYSFWDAQRTATAQTLSTVDFEISEAENSLARMNYFLIDTLVNSKSINDITAANRDLDRNFAARNLLNELDFDTRYWAANYSFSFFSDSLSYPISKLDPAVDYKASDHIRGIIRKIAKSDEKLVNTLNWSHVVFDNSLYLYQVYYDKGSYFASWIPCDVLFSDIKLSALTEDGRITYLDEENMPLLSSDVNQAEPIEPAPSDLQVNMIYPIERSGINLLIEDVPYIDTWNIAFLFVFMFLVVLFLMAVSIFTLRYYRRNIEAPLANFKNHVNEYALMKQNAKTAGFAELNEAVAVFDSITEQLRELKIDIYEERLSIIKAQLQYYHLQIKPHFFVNCFTIIHAMAQKKDYERIQEFCIKLSNYVRFLLADSLDFVPLRDELSMMYEYLDIQKIQHKTNSTLHGEIDPALNGTKIPPLIILTFVENSIKYGPGGSGKDVTIDVKIQELYLDGEKKLRIIISDDGVGFPEEILEYNNIYENNLEDSEGSRHIGIRNIQMRLYLLYGDNRSLKFSNIKDESGETAGSRVEIIIPVKE